MSEPTQSTGEQPHEPRPFQFGLKWLFVVTFVVAVFCSVFVQFGLSGMCIAAWALIFGMAVASIWWKRIRPMLLPSVVICVLFMLSLPAVQNGSPSPRMHCRNNLKQVALALLNYESAHGCFPPAYITDESGRPTHSWRVLILPYMEQRAVFDRCRFDEPWDGPYNAKINLCPHEFQCPCDIERRKDEPPELATSYVAVVGPNTAWPGEKSLRLDDFTDGTANTILLVEVADSGIHWLEPRDLHVRQMAPGVNPKSGQGISSVHRGGANVVFADGSVHFIRDDITPELLRALLTPAGGEKIERWD